MRYLIAGGGTSGHINPALAIAAEIEKHEQAEILFCGTAHGLESEMVPLAGYEIETIRAKGLPSRLNLDFFKALKELYLGQGQCAKLIRSFQPNAVIGTGGYVCSPLIAAAAKAGIPALLHEQNAYPGRSNRMLAGRCQCVCISFAGTEKYFRTKAPIVLSGNPVKEEFFHLDRKSAREQLGLNKDTTLILFMGGSLGSATINQAVLGLFAEKKWQNFIRKNPDLSLVLAAGRQHYAEVKQKQTVNNLPLTVQEYLFEAALWMAAANLIVARAGAMTCAELAALGRASILIPYPYAAGDHQTYNARVLADSGAAIMQADSDCTPDWLAAQLIQLLETENSIRHMEREAKKQAAPDAAKIIYDALRKISK